MLRQLRFRHFILVGLGSLVGVLILWFALAYGGLPRVWSHHEHKLVGRRHELVSFTAQDIPGDPINLRLLGQQDAIVCALRRAGWSLADPVSGRSALRIASSVILGRAYPEAPVSPLYVKDRAQDLAFQKDEGTSAKRRHHVRFWQIAPNDWLAAATFDRGVGLSLFTMQITHHIGPDIDAERRAVGVLLLHNGATFTGSESAQLPQKKWHRNGGGDRYFTDGRIFVFRLASVRCA